MLRLLRARPAAQPGGAGALLLRRALSGRTIDLNPREVTDGERPIITPPPASTSSTSSTSSCSNGSGGSGSAAAEQRGQAQAGTTAAPAGGKAWGLFPDDIVAHLDRFVVGQEEAKKATAIALRSRWRRSQLPEDIRAEVAPTNMLFKVRAYVERVNVYFVCVCVRWSVNRF